MVYWQVNITIIILTKLSKKIYELKNKQIVASIKFCSNALRFASCFGCTYYCTVIK